MTANPTEITCGEWQKKRKTLLFAHLEDILALATRKRHIDNLTDGVKQSWCRISISCIEAYGRLLADVEVTQLNERLSRLEEKEQGGA